ncbi:MAG: hypothetical protein M1608_09845 [Candidatus Omnitrophica bacterium]|nr:hypothetical protein [Candidatus Omnitrophota bacterium]
METKVQFSGRSSASPNPGSREAPDTEALTRAMAKGDEMAWLKEAVLAEWNHESPT